jgi:hypothetical protein
VTLVAAAAVVGARRAGLVVVSRARPALGDVAANETAGGGICPTEAGRARSHLSSAPDS